MLLARCPGAQLPSAMINCYLLGLHVKHISKLYSCLMVISGLMQLEEACLSSWKLSAIDWEGNLFTTFDSHVRL